MTDRDSEFRSLYQALRIEDQKKYYEDRRKEYEAAHRQAVAARNTLLGLAALTSIAGQFTEPTLRGALAVAAALLAALAVAVTGFEALIGFPQLTKLYTDAARNLAVEEINWTTRAADADVEGDVSRVEDIFTREISQWGQLVSEAAAEAAKTAEDVVARSQPTRVEPEPPVAGGR
ncbi:SLATT domain-containing protein [Geodermatophilus sp. SYSU D00691]